MPVSSKLWRMVPSKRPTVGKFCTPEKPSAFSSARNCGISTNGIGAVDAGEHRRVLDHRQHLARHLLDDLVGVAVGEQARRRAAPGHAVAAGIVDDDQVDAAGLLALRREAGAGAAADDRDARAAPCRGTWRGCPGAGIIGMAGAILFSQAQRDGRAAGFAFRGRCICERRPADRDFRLAIAIHLRRLYRIDMPVSGQARVPDRRGRKGAAGADEEDACSTRPWV